MKLKLLFFMLISVFSIQAKDGFSSKPDGLTFPNIGIVGTITNWGSSPDIAMTTMDGINYLASNVTFPSNGQMKFRQDQSWDVQWSNNQFPSGFAVSNGQDIPVPFGSYDISLNIQTGAYSFTLLPSQFPQIGIIGEFNGWSESVNMPTSDGVVYTLSDYYFPAPGVNAGLKFRQDNSWETNWGGPGFPSGTAVVGSSNIPVQQGFYNVSFNLSTLEYSFTPVVMSIIGSADVDFNTDTAMQTTNGMMHTMTNQLLSTGGLKFRKLGSWDVNFGATGFPTGVGVNNGDNIPVLAGVYDITLNRLTGEYSFVTSVSNFPMIGLIGEFNGWSQSVNMFTTDGVLYTFPNFYVPAPGGDAGLKFRQDNSWETNWGGASFPSGTAVLGINNNIPAQQGFYNVTFNLSTLEYSFEPVMMAIIGTADVDFNSDTAMETTDGMIHTLNNKTLSTGLLKFRTVGNWNVNFGASSFPAGIGVNNGNDIPVVAGVYNITFNRLTGAYNFAEVMLPTTQLRSQFCNITVASMNANLFADVVESATAYKFKVGNGGNSQEIQRPDSRFSMAFASGIMLNTTYEISVAVYVNGVWTPYGAICSITTPNAFPTSTLRSQFCNTTLSTINDNVYANVVVGAAGYKFKLENNGNMQEIERPDSRFSMAFATGINAGTTYSVSVSLNFNGVWQPYGSVCTITTPASLPTSQLRPQFCNGTVTAINSNFFAVFRSGATAYKFKTIINGSEVEVVRPDSRCFMSAFSGAVANQTYPMQVAVQFNNVWSDFGPVCNLTVGNVVSREITTEAIVNNFEIKAYPNPFVSHFTLLFSTENLETNVSIFDMTGKMVQSFKTSETEVVLGENLTAGVYLVNITQGQETKNIRVVKH